MINTVPKVTLFDGHKKRKQRQQEQERRQDAILQQAALEAQEVSRDATLKFLYDFLENSIWKDQVDQNQISIAWDQLPSMHELNTYGELDEGEGTKACRRLFKAVVIWDDLGHGLWQKLKADAHRSGRVSRELAAALAAQGSSGYLTPQRSRGSSRSSIETKFSRKSRKGSTDTVDSSASDTPRRSSVADTSPSTSRIVPTRSVTEPLCCSDCTTKTVAASRYKLPKIIPSGCANAMRKTMGAFGESMIQGHGGNAL
ncbi:hypothetical protein B0J13DRAFT_530056 [Dactylonectria estremocensis]|uniref:Uncharacterized protein n=1 Tax=Dactylonectria estremocensis TaxID=1079267 RepID=A0A9P9E322_9HYPO|nr:hypothetical protein B0J13DRAFT_530056 [Dactylonectria estremocensis]